MVIDGQYFCVTYGILDGVQSRLTITFPGYFTLIETLCGVPLSMCSIVNVSVRFNIHQIRYDRGYDI